MILYLLDKSQKAIQAIPSEKLVEAKYTEGINEASKLTFSVPLKERLPSYAFFALFQKPDCPDFLLFKINNETIENDRISYMGVDAAYDELKSYSYVKDIRPVQKTAKEILQRVLQGTRWEVGYIDSTGTMDTNFYYQPLLECIQNIAQLFNMEVVFTYGFDSKYQVITSRKVNFYQQQGQRTGKRFEYGSNLLTVTREEDSQDIVTALVGRGKGEEETDEETGEATGGYGRRINFSDVVWSKAKGDPTDKPAGQEYVEDVQATKVFGYDDGKPRIGIVVFEDIEDPVELLKATWTSLKSSDRPKVTFKADVTDVGNLGLGDTIAIIRHELGIEYFTRVFKVIHDLLNKQNNTVEMGDDLSGNSLTSYISNVDTIAKQAVQGVSQVALAAGSKNKNYYSTTKPAIADEGDNLFLNLGNGSFEYWVWHNHQWKFIQSTQDLHNIEQNVKEAQQGLTQVEARVKQNHDSANKALTTINETLTGLTAKVDDGINKSEFEALSNQLNLKVSKDNIIGQLNIEAGSTLIQNKKLYLDTDSVVFSGKAFIPDAAITNISADKITAGTLDAGKINVINLNADNIVAGTLSGKNINMNLVTGRVVFTAGRFYDQKERFDINIDENYVRSSEKTNYIYIGDDSVEENYTITELKGGEICISRPTLKSDTINGKQVWSFAGRENIFQLTTSEINQSVFGDTSSPVTALVNKNGFVITGDKYITESNLLNLVGWKDDFLGIVVDTANNTGITVNSGKAKLTLCGGKVTTDSWINTQAEIVLGLDPGRIDFDANEANFSGDLTVSGSKNAIVPTSKGMAAINAYETAEYYFGDIGKAKTDENGQVIIQLDPLFLETVNTSIPYHVFISSYGNATVWAEQMDKNSFLVKSSKPNIKFSWEIKAKRLGYENNRLKIAQKGIPKKLVKRYKEKGIL